MTNNDKIRKPIFVRIDNCIIPLDNISGVCTRNRIARNGVDVCVGYHTAVCDFRRETVNATVDEIETAITDALKNAEIQENR